MIYLAVPGEVSPGNLERSAVIYRLCRLNIAMVRPIVLLGAWDDREKKKKEREKESKD